MNTCCLLLLAAAVAAARAQMLGVFSPYTSRLTSTFLTSQNVGGGAPVVQSRSLEEAVGADGQGVSRHVVQSNLPLAGDHAGNTQVYYYESALPIAVPAAIMGYRPGYYPFG